VLEANAWGPGGSCCAWATTRKKTALQRIRALVAGACLFGESQKALEVQVALNIELQGIYPDSPGGGVVDEAHRQAGGQSMQHHLHRIRALVGSKQDGGLIALEGEGSGPRGVLMPCSIEPLDAGLDVAPRNPVGVRAEAETGQVRVSLDSLNRGHKPIDVDAVKPVLRGHILLLRWGWTLPSPSSG